jgi:hypothetical protein
MEAFGIIEGEGMFGHAGRAGEVSDSASDSREVACEKVKGGMLPDPEYNEHKWIKSGMQVGKWDMKL